MTSHGPMLYSPTMGAPERPDEMMPLIVRAITDLVGYPHLLSSIVSTFGNMENCQLSIAVLHRHAGSRRVRWPHVDLRSQFDPCPLIFWRYKFACSEFQGWVLLGPVGRSLLPTFFDLFCLRPSLVSVDELLELITLGWI